MPYLEQLRVERSYSAQTLAAYRADLVHLIDVAIERFNLAQQPMAFVDNPTAKAFLERSGAYALPLIMVNGEIALAGRYPQRSELARWAGIPLQEKAEESSCCGGCC